jgi:hypothetical protein
MSPDQRNQLQRAAWQGRADLEAAILADLERQEPYSLGNILYRRPRRKVPVTVWIFLAAAIAALIIAF